MVDVHTPEQRSRNMSAIRGKDTKPEKIVRSLVHSRGYRYRLHYRKLPGKPDMVFPSRRKVIFIHGCYWHSHDCRFGQVIPKTNAEFWQSKRQGNVLRDLSNLEKLAADGWQSLVIWECQTKDRKKLEQIIRDFLS